MRWLGRIAMFAAVAGCATPAADAVLPYRVEGDESRARRIPAPGDAARGKTVVLSRDSNCLLCHVVPGSGVRAMGNVGQSLAGVGAKLTEGQLRLRIVDSMRLNRNTVMPSYYRVDELNAVAGAWRGKPILTAQQVEDTVAYLLTLR